MMLFFLSLRVLFGLFPPTTAQNNQPAPVLLMTRVSEQNCAVFKVYDYGNHAGHYKTALAKRDDAAFYYIDEDKQELIVQKKVEDDQYFLRYIFIADKKTYEIQLTTCAENLGRNKKELYTFQQKILNKEVL